MALERELKLTGPLPDLSDVAEIAGYRLALSRTEQQTNTYFDTPSANLRSVGVSLRLRQIAGGRGVYTYKGQSSVSGGWHQKTELEQDAGDATGLEYLRDPQIVHETVRRTLRAALEGARPGVPIAVGPVGGGAAGPHADVRTRLATTAEFAFTQGVGDRPALGPHRLR